MAHITKRVRDTSFAQKEREKRRRKVLMDQMRALRSQEVGGGVVVGTVCGGCEVLYSPCRRATARSSW